MPKIIFSIPATKIQLFWNNQQTIARKKTQRGLTPLCHLENDGNNHLEDDVATHVEDTLTACGIIHVAILQTAQVVLIGCV